MSGVLSKKQCRARQRAELFAVNENRRAEESQTCISALKSWLGEAEIVSGFWPLAHEVDLRQLWIDLIAEGRQVLLPRCHDKTRLSWHEFAGANELLAGPLGLLEPDPEQHPEIELPAAVAMIVPGLAFGCDGRRLGQGLGYYDRVLGHPQRDLSRVVGVGLSIQRNDHLPQEDHDVRLQAVLLGGEWLLGGDESSS